MLARALAFLVLATATPALADGYRTPLLKTGPASSIQAYGRQNPACTEWTDGCVVCTATGGRSHCSTPGIACTPAGLTCKRHATP
jgi:hypothetical protein